MKASTSFTCDPYSNFTSASGYLINARPIPPSWTIFVRFVSPILCPKFPITAEIVTPLNILENVSIDETIIASL